jgi:hypothetical protein
MKKEKDTPSRSSKKEDKKKLVPEKRSVVSH